MTRGMTRGSARNDAMTRDDTIFIEGIRARARARRGFKNHPYDASSRVMPSSDPPPGDRHARYRARQRDGKAVYAVELGAAELDWLIRLQWLAEGEASDRDAVGRAIGAMLQDAARR